MHFQCYHLTTVMVDVQYVDVDINHVRHQIRIYQELITRPASM